MVRLSLSVIGRRPPTGLPERALASGAVRSLVDSHGRAVRDLRLSITDRCNFRCVYCMEPDTTFLEAGRLLTVPEFIRIARLCMNLGVERIRITGGEPTLHPELDRIIEGLAGLAPSDLSMTTNGSRCSPENLARWKRLGLRRLTFSLDAVEPAAFARITRARDARASQAVIDAIGHAIGAGLGPVKVNAVIMRGYNEDQVGPLTLLAREMGFEMRFIEFMPLDAGHRWDPRLLVPAAEILAHATGAAELAPMGRPEPSSTSETFTFVGHHAGGVGIIAPVTRPFCGACSRLRITADGQVRPCLFSLQEFDLRAAMRAGELDRDLENRLLAAVWSKQAGHGIGAPDFHQPDRTMSAIGG